MFRWTKSYFYSCSTVEMTNELKRLLKQERNIEGSVNTTGLDLSFCSDFNLRLITQLPLLKVTGSFIPSDKKGELKITATLQPLAKYIFLFAIIVIWGFYFSEKYTDLNFGGKLDSDTLLYSPVFAYCFLMAIFIIESVDCKSYFARLISDENNAP